VVLAEDAARYTEFRGERGGGGDMGSVPASSHQIYLTFPAESTFIEEDVATYFGYTYCTVRFQASNSDVHQVLNYTLFEFCQ
jgi:hypothetical protein